MKWSLDTAYKGGSSSKELLQAIKKWKQALATFRKGMKSDAASIDALQMLSKELCQFSSFVHCLAAANVNDEKASALRSQITDLGASFEVASNEFLQKLSLKTIAGTKGIRYQLQKLKEIQLQKMPVEKENLAAELAISGYHAWYDLYSMLSGRIRIPYKKKVISFAEADNLLDNRDRSVREEVFSHWSKTAKDNEYIFAQTLNQMAGFRLKLYENRGWDSPIHEALQQNNMEEKSLRAMWSAVSDCKPLLKKLLQKKAKFLKLKKLAWHDVDAPLPLAEKPVSYKEGCKIIERHFGAVSQEMSQFAKDALAKNWVDAEDRGNKAPGGFCTPLPLSHESRIFMTYSNTFSNLLTLAHELGHAYHSHVLFQLPWLQQEYPMTLAETASTFAEHVIMEGMLKEASSKERLAILHNKAMRSTCFFMDIQARFDFEESFYEERKKGVVSAEKLSELMHEAQVGAYADELEKTHPYFWITKQHFYFSGAPFYNFPYTVGYLFSLALVGKMRKDPKGFSAHYVQFLQDTGSMSLEAIAKKHFGADLSKKTFWNEALQVARGDIEAFLNLTNN